MLWLWWSALYILLTHQNINHRVSLHRHHNITFAEFHHPNSLNNDTNQTNNKCLYLTFLIVPIAHHHGALQFCCLCVLALLRATSIKVQLQPQVNYAHTPFRTIINKTLQKHMYGWPGAISSVFGGVRCWKWRGESDIPNDTSKFRCPPCHI